MAIFIWNDSYKTGEDTIDKQHKKLIDLLNRLEESFSLGGDDRIVIGLLDELVKYTEYHFSCEERFMISHNYDDESFKEHQQVHQAFVEQILTAQKECQANPNKVTDELFEFLVQWMVDHIMLSDKQMVESCLATGHHRVEQQEHVDLWQSNLYGALKESETRFKELADTLPALLWISDAKGKRIFVNKNYSELTGLSVEECIKENGMKGIHQDDLEAFQCVYDTVTSTLEPATTEYRLIQKDGEVSWILETVLPRKREDGEVSGFMGCGIDISRQKQIEKSLEETVEKRTEELQKTNQVLKKEKEEQETLNNQLKETQGHLVQSEKMASIGQLAAGVAHEINNPLGYIYSNLSTLKSYLSDLEKVSAMAEKLSAELPSDNAMVKAFNQLKTDLDLSFLQEDLQDLVKESIEGATRAKKIVQDLRDFSRIDKQEKEIFDVEAGLDATLNIVHNELKYKADIIKEYSGIKPFECVGAQLNQVFMNLLVNAAHAIVDFGKITVRTGYEGDEWVWVEIEDNGKGMSEDVKSKIFDPFFTTKPVGKGTGLGLSLSYKIIQDHQGWFDVDSVVGKGTRFRVCFPLNENAVND